MAETTNNTKRNVFGSNHQKKVQGLRSEHRTLGHFHCSATAAYWHGSEKKQQTCGPDREPRSVRWRLTWFLCCFILSCLHIRTVIYAYPDIYPHHFFWITPTEKEDAGHMHLFRALFFCANHKKPQSSKSFFGLHKFIQCAAIPFFLLFKSYHVYWLWYKTNIVAVDPALLLFSGHVFIWWYCTTRGLW